MIVKCDRGRQRFLGNTKIEIESNNWMSQIFAFKSLIRSQTQYQLIDNKVYWDCDRSLDNCVPMLAIIGTPVEHDPSFIIQDFEAGSFWIKSLPFHQDFVFPELKTQIISVLPEIPLEMGQNFHLVIDDEKIELHFFLQKDYIG